MGKFTFTRAERLKKEKWIKDLFARGSAFHVYPLRIIFLPHPEPDFPVSQVLISVSVRNFKRAVDRNLLKRRIREAYRLQKAVFPGESKSLIAYIYTSKTIENFDKIKASLMKSSESIKAKMSG